MVANIEWDEEIYLCAGPKWSRNSFFLLFFSKMIERVFCYHYYVSMCVTVIRLLEFEPVNRHLRLMAYKLRRWRKLKQRPFWFPRTLKAQGGEHVNFYVVSDTSPIYV